MIPVSAYRYLTQERKAAEIARAQNGKGTHDGDAAEKESQIADTILNSRSDPRAEA